MILRTESLAYSWASACVASVVRVVAFDQVDFHDITYTIVTASIWTTIEQSIGIICACLPPTRPLFGRLLHNIKHSSGHDVEGQKAVHSSENPLSRYASRPAVNGLADIGRDGFARLSEENTVELGSVTAHASNAASDDLPIVADRIVRQQRLEQQVE